MTTTIFVVAVVVVLVALYRGDIDCEPTSSGEGPRSAMAHLACFYEGLTRLR